MKKKTYIAPEATIHTVTLQPLLTPSLTESGNQLRIDMSGTPEEDDAAGACSRRRKNVWDENNEE
jgi:hypothetical protein